MTLLRISRRATQELRSDIKKASELLICLVVVDVEDSRRECRESIQAYMVNAPLSDWFSLYIHLLFRYLHQQKFQDRDLFLDVIGNVHFMKLHRELVWAYADMNDSLSRLARQKIRLETQSSSDLFKTLGEISSVKDQSVRLEERLARCKQQTLVRFNLVVTIISMLESMGRLSSDKVLAITNEMLHHPRAFIGQIAATLVELQGIDQKKLAAVNINKRVDKVVQCILKLLCFEGNDKELIFLIRENLFKQKYLSLVEKKDIGLFGAPHKSVSVLLEDDIEDVATHSYR